MFERILVAVDGSAESSKTLPAAIEMAERFGSSVTVVHIREHAKFEGSDVDLGPDIDPEHLVADAVALFVAR